MVQYLKYLLFHTEVLRVSRGPTRSGVEAHAMGEREEGKEPQAEPEMRQQEGLYGNGHAGFDSVVQWSQQISCFTFDFG